MVLIEKEGKKEGNTVSSIAPANRSADIKKIIQMVQKCPSLPILQKSSAVPRIPYEIMILSKVSICSPVKLYDGHFAILHRDVCKCLLLFQQISAEAQDVFVIIRVRIL